MNKNHVLKQTHVGEVMVSTISLIALDVELNSMMGRPPEEQGLISSMGKFETMVFGPGEHNEQYRYDTVEEALKHHDELVKQLELIEQSIKCPHCGYEQPFAQTLTLEELATFTCPSCNQRMEVGGG